jgi:two-component system cell cycle response regulator
MRKKMARILVIEDNPASLELITYLLTAFGHSVYTAEDGGPGIAIARAEQPDLVLCDMQLPRVSGYEVVRRLKADARTSAIPMVAITALAMVGDREQILAAGFDGYVAKPIVPETFVASVEQFLAASQHGVSAAQPIAPAAPVAVDTQRAERALILVIDDTRINHELMCGILEPLGFGVLEADNGVDGLRLARERLPDLIISDLHMPAGNGFDLLRAIKEDRRTQHIPVIIHSATYQSEHDRREALRLGAIEFLSGPIEPESLHQRINMILRAQREHTDGNHPGR